MKEITKIGPTAHTLGPSRKAPPSAKEGFHPILRDTTRREHELIDLRLSSLDLTTAHSYRIFLNIHYTALRSLAVAWRSEDTREFGDWLHRLREDLCAMDASIDERIIPFDHVLEPWHRLGVSYVIRGSRLGSKLLSRRVPSQLSSSYLEHEAAMPWPVFLLELEHQAEQCGSRVQTQIIDGAKFAFGAFEAAAHRAALPTPQVPG